MPVNNKKLQWQNEVLAGLQEIVAEMITELDLQAVLQKAVERTAALVEADTVTIHIYDPLTGQVRAAAGYGLLDSKTFQQHRPDRGKVALLVASSGEPVIAEDVSASKLAGPFAARESVQSAAGFPLKVGDKVIGVLFVNYRGPHKFEPEEIETLVSFGNLAAVAIENANLIEQERQRADAMDLLQQVSAEISAKLDEKETLALIIEGAMRLTGTDSGVIHLVDEARQAVIRSYEVPEGFGHLPPRFSQKTGMAWEAVTTGQTIAVPDITKDQRVNPAMTEKGVRAVIGTPLKVEGKTIGVLFLNDSKPHEFTEYEKELLSTLASHAATAHENARLFEDAQRRIRDLEIVNEVVQVMSTKLDTKGLLHVIVTQIADKLKCTHCTLFFPKEEKGELLLVPQVTHGVRSKEIMTRRFKPGQGLAGWVFQHGESLVLDNAMDDPRFSPAREAQAQPRSMLVAPVKVGDQTIGVISADQDEYGWFSESDRRLLDALARQAGIAIERDVGLDLLQDIGNRIISAPKVEDVLQQIVAGAIKLTNTTSGVIYLISEDGKSVTQGFQHPPGFDHPAPRMDKEGGLTRQVIETGKVLIFPDIHQDARVNPVLHNRVRSMIAIPLKLEQRVIGVLYLNDADPHDFTETEVSLLSTLASQAAVAIENARLFETRRRLNAQLESLHQVVQEQSLEEVLDRIIGGINAILGEGTSPTINLYEKETGSFGQCHAYGPLKDVLMVPPRSDGTGRYVLKTGEPLYLDDVLNPPPGCPTVRDESIARGIKSFAALPLKRQEQMVGVLFVNLQKPVSFSEEIRRVLELFASQAAIAIENARLYEHISQNLERRIQELEVLTEIGRTVSTLGIDQILDLVYKQTTKVMDLSDALFYIAFYDEQRDEVSFGLMIEQDEGEAIDEIRWGKRDGAEVREWMPRARRDPPGLTEYVIRAREPVLIVEDFDTRAEERGIRVWARLGKLERPTRSWLGVPMMVGDRVVGVISIQSLERESAFDQDHLELLATVANQAAVAIENARLYADLQEKVDQLESAQAKIRQMERVRTMANLAADFVHRINNMAGTIPIRVQRIQETLEEAYPEVKPALLPYLQGIMDDTRELLTASQRLQKSTQETQEPKLVNIKDLLETIVRQVRLQTPPSIEVRDEHLAAELPLVWGVEDELEEAIRDVTTNAVEAMAAEGGRLEISAASSLDSAGKAWIEIEVKDEGPGIPEDVLPNIFELFYTTKRTGLGYGLWRTKSTVEMLGGEITVDSEVGRGTMVHIRLPAAER
jgi:GAF domain-containing protein/two-component sensor histidine kinase